LTNPHFQQQDRNRGADRLVHALGQFGVDAVFSLSGNQIMPIYDALVGSSIRLVHTRHEAAAVFMSEAYAQVSDNLGVALVTAAPGFGNALGALYSAAMAEVPVILISGDSPTGQDGQGAFQQFDQIAAASPFVKASFRLSRGDDPAQVFTTAARIALGGIPGPVHMAVPVDVIESVFDSDLIDSENSNCIDQTTTLCSPTPDQIENIVNVFGESERPLILAGPHLFRGKRKDKQHALSLALDAPIIVLESPRGLRDPAQGALRELLYTADCILYLGKPVDFTSGFGKENAMPATKVIIVSEYAQALIHAKEVFKNRLVLTEQANAVATMNGLLTYAKHLKNESCTALSRSNWNKAAATAIAHRQLINPSDDAHYSKQIIEIVAQTLKDNPDTILICDGGEFGQWAQAFVSSNIRITNGPAGAIGASLPYAIGATVAHSQAPVLAIMGDGTAGFHLAEFETAARESSGLTVLIGNDSRWNAEHHLQVEQYGVERAFGCELSSDARYDLAAIGLGCDGVLVKDLSQLHAALSDSLQSSRPTCINVLMPGAPAPMYKKIDLTGVL
jgi:acetolactate synthase-1/2/3 large subunit